MKTGGLIENSEHREFIDNELLTGTSLGALAVKLRGRGFKVSKSTLQQRRNLLKGDSGDTEAINKRLIDLESRKEGYDKFQFNTELNKLQILLFEMYDNAVKAAHIDVEKYAQSNGILPSLQLKLIRDIQDIMLRHDKILNGDSSFKDNEGIKIGDLGNEEMGTID